MKPGKLQTVAVIDDHVVLLVRGHADLADGFRFDGKDARGRDDDVVNVPIVREREIVKDVAAVREQMVEFLGDGLFAAETEPAVGALPRKVNEPGGQREKRRGQDDDAAKPYAGGRTRGFWGGGEITNDEERRQADQPDHEVHQLTIEPLEPAAERITRRAQETGRNRRAAFPRLMKAPDMNDAGERHHGQRRQQDHEERGIHVDSSKKPSCKGSMTDVRERESALGNIRGCAGLFALQAFEPAEQSDSRHCAKAKNHRPNRVRPEFAAVPTQRQPHRHHGSECEKGDARINNLFGLLIHGRADVTARVDAPVPKIVTPAFQPQDFGHKPETGGAT